MIEVSRAGCCSKRVALLVLWSAVLLLVANAAQAQTTVSYPNFSSTSGLALNPSAAAPVGDGHVLRLTPSQGGLAGSAWYFTGSSDAPVGVPLAGGFTSTFAFQISVPAGSAGVNGKPGADGFAFVVQGVGTGALGAGGGYLGYTNIANSVAVQFDTWCNTDFGDTCAGDQAPTSADEVSVQSCGPNPNTAAHNALSGPGGVTCTFGRFDLTQLKNQILLADGQTHTAQIVYTPPASTDGTCLPGGGNFCGSIAVTLDGQAILTVPFSIGYLGLHANSDAFVGFTAGTGAAYENHDILNWNFTYNSTSQTQAFDTTGPTQSTFNSGENNLVQQTIDATDAGDLTCHNSDGGTAVCGGVQVTATNTPLSNNSGMPNAFPPYVTGTPWSSAQCAGRPGNGGTGDLCSLYVNACWGGSSGVGQAAASDFYCPFVDTAANTTGFFVLKDTWDPLSPKPAIAPGTTVSLLDFVPPTATETWSGSAMAPNPVCTQVAPIAGNPGTAAKCDVVDTAIDIYNDQTTTRGTQPKKGWLISLFNVQMLLSTVQVFSNPVNTINPPLAGCTSPHSPLNNPNPADPGFENPNYAQNIWNNGNCLLGFLVNPAQPPVPDNNNFVAAPPASLFYGPGAPSIAPGGAPEGDTTITNPNAVCIGTGLSCNAQPWASNPNDRKTLASIFGAPDGTFTLHYQSKDGAGITEKNAVFRPTGDPCPNPEAPGTTIPAPCYYTNYFTTIVNIDSTFPTVSLTFSPLGGTYAVNQAGVSASFSCNDPMAANGAAASGLASCVASVDGGSATSTSPVALKVGTAGSHKVTVTATDNAGNLTRQDFPYTVLADADVAIFEQHTSDSVKPGGTLTYLAWVLDLSKTNAAEVSVTEQLQLPASGVQLGNITASVAIVSCTLTGCSAMPPSGGASCTVSGTTVNCNNIGTLPSIFGLKGAVIVTKIPVSSSSTPGTSFRLTATASSPNDPNTKNNVTTDTLSVSSH